MRRDERLALLDDAKLKLREAIDFIQKAVRGTSSSKLANMYIIGGIENWIGPEDGSIPVQPGCIADLEILLKGDG